MPVICGRQTCANLDAGIPSCHPNGATSTRPGGQRVEHSMRMSQHITHCHQKVYKQMQQLWHHLQQRFRGCTRPSTCPHCAAKVRALSQHKCPVLAQIASKQTCLSDEATMQTVMDKAESQTGRAEQLAKMQPGMEAATQPPHTLIPLSCEQQAGPARGSNKSEPAESKAGSAAAALDSAAHGTQGNHTTRPQNRKRPQSELLPTLYRFLRPAHGSNDWKCQAGQHMRERPTR